VLPCKYAYSFEYAVEAKIKSPIGVIKESARIQCLYQSWIAMGLRLEQLRQIMSPRMSRFTL
jgi:hypothetical protein